MPAVDNVQVTNAKGSFPLSEYMFGIHVEKPPLQAAIETDTIPINGYNGEFRVRGEHFGINRKPTDFTIRGTLKAYDPTQTQDVLDQLRARLVLLDELSRLTFNDGQQRTVQAILVDSSIDRLYAYPHLTMTWHVPNPYGTLY